MGHSGDDAVQKIPHKMKTHWQNQLKILVWFNLKFSIEVGVYKDRMLYLSNAPLIIYFITAFQFVQNYKQLFIFARVQILNAYQERYS